MVEVIKKPLVIQEIKFLLHTTRSRALSLCNISLIALVICRILTRIELNVMITYQ